MSFLKYCDYNQITFDMLIELKTSIKTGYLFLTYSEKIDLQGILREYIVYCQKTDLVSNRILAQQCLTLMRQLDQIRG